jgi:hypothetical protein
MHSTFNIFSSVTFKMSIIIIITKIITNNYTDPGGPKTSGSYGFGYGTLDEFISNPGPDPPAKKGRTQHKRR